MQTRPKTELRKAIFFILCATVFNTVMIFFVKIAAADLPVRVIICARYLITLIIVLPFICYNKEKLPVFSYLKTNRLPLHLVRDVVGFVGLFSYFYSAKLISLVNATVLFNTAPLFIPLIAHFWGKVKIVHSLWIGLFIGFIGVLFILNPTKGLLHPGSLIGLLSGFCAAIVFIGTRYLLYSETPLKNMFYYFFVGTIISLMTLLFSHTDLKNVFTAKSIFLLCAIGFSGYCYQWCFATSSKYGPVRLTSSFMYTSVIFALIPDWFVWHIAPSLTSIIGIGLVIIGALALIFLTSSVR